MPPPPCPGSRPRGLVVPQRPRGGSGPCGQLADSACGRERKPSSGRRRQKKPAPGEGAPASSGGPGGQSNGEAPQPPGVRGRRDRASRARASAPSSPPCSGSVRRVLAGAERRREPSSRSVVSSNGAGRQHLQFTRSLSISLVQVPMRRWRRRCRRSWSARGPRYMKRSMPTMRPTPSTRSGPVRLQAAGQRGRGRRR